MNSKLRVVVVVAHPDDESWMAGSTIQRLTSAGHLVRLLSLTPGDNAWLVREQQVKASTMRSLRRRELRRACRILGVHEYRILSFRDGQLSTTPARTLVSSVEHVFKKWQPDVILTFANDGLTGHADHCRVSPIVMQAARRREPTTIVVQLTYPARLKVQLGWRTATSGRLVKISTTKKSRDVKHRAIKVYASQPRTLQRFELLSEKTRRSFLANEYAIASASTRQFVARHLT